MRAIEIKPDTDISKLPDGKYFIRRNDFSKKVFTINNSPSKTDQSFAEQCDINNIIRRYQKTGQVSHLSKHQGIYADISEIPDLQGAFQAVQDAQSAFMTLPASLREKFQNDPIQFVEYLSDSRNDEEAISLGLKEPLPEPSQSSVSQKSKKSTKVVNVPAEPKEPDNNDD